MGGIEFHAQREMEKQATYFFVDLIGAPKHRDTMLDFGPSYLTRLNFDDLKAAFTEKEVLMAVYIVVGMEATNQKELGGVDMRVSVVFSIHLFDLFFPL